MAEQAVEASTSGRTAGRTSELTKARVDAGWRRRSGAKEVLRDHKVRGLHLSIRSQSATWAFEYKLPGAHPDTGRRWPTRTLTLGKLAPTFHLDEARTAALAAKAMVAKGIDPLGEKKAAVHRNLAAVADAEREQTVAEFVRAYRSRREAGWRTATRAAFKGDLQVIVDRLGTMPLSKVTRRQLVNLVDGFHAEQVEAGGKGTRSARIAMLLGSLFRDAMDRGLIELSPAQALPRPVGHFTRARVLDAEEIALAWRTLRQPSGHGVGAPARLALLISLATGQRIGTVGSARVDELALDGAGDHDLEDRGPVWRIPGEDGRKARRDRVVPLSGLAVELWREALALPGRSGPFVFPIRGTGRVGHVRQDSLSTAWGTLAGKGELPAATTAHDLRRSARTWWSRLRHGQTRDVLERLLGHAVAGRVEAAYDHASYLPQQRLVAEAWADKLRAIVGGGAEVVPLAREAQA